MFEFKIGFPDLEIQDEIIEILSRLEFGYKLVGPLKQSCTNSNELIILEKKRKHLEKLISDIRSLLLQGSVEPSQLLNSNVIYKSYANL